MLTSIVGEHVAADLEPLGDHMPQATLGSPKGGLHHVKSLSLQASRKRKEPSDLRHGTFRIRCFSEQLPVKAPYPRLNL